VITELFRIPADSILLDGSYNLTLVLLSLLIAILSSAAALISVELSRQNPLRWQRQLGLLAGSISLGIGIWSMHFIGMLAFRLCTPVDYAANITLLSLLPSVLASWVALNLLRRKQIKAIQLIGGGVLVGAGIGAMHYSGMAAMQMAVQLRYDLGYFALSIVVAVIMATLALWIRFGVRSLQDRLAGWQLNLLSGSVMGLAISTMHYTGMLAARFVAPPGFTATADVANSQQMALIVTCVSILVTLLVLLLQAVMKFYHAKQSLNRSEPINIGACYLSARRSKASVGILPKIFCCPRRNKTGPR
jgi:NO-binding membrane sensor protein with MHYT domain